MNKPTQHYTIRTLSLFLFFAAWLSGNYNYAQYVNIEIMRPPQVFVQLITENKNPTSETGIKAPRIETDTIPLKWIEISSDENIHVLIGVASRSHAKSTVFAYKINTGCFDKSKIRRLSEGNMCFSLNLLQKERHLNDYSRFRAWLGVPKKEQLELQIVYN